MKKSLLIIILTIIPFSFIFADTVTINHFAVKENPFAKDEVAIIAMDTANNILENVSGTYGFTVNGFDEALTFEKGTAFYRHKLDKSAFLYVKHVNPAGTHSMLYYVYKHDKLIPIHISWILLFLVPVVLILITWVFRKFFILAVIIFCVFLYFNYHNGLSIPTFFESIFDGIKNLFK